MQLSLEASALRRTPLPTFAKDEGSTVSGVATAAQGKRVRLDRAVANLGYGSRTQVRELISRGRVAANGAVVRDPTTPVHPHELEVDGQPVDHPHGVLVALHKPVGFVCSHDLHEGRLVYELLPEHWSGRSPQVVSIGRLDKDTSGLLVLTDDHALVHRLTSPKHHVTKTYRATVDRLPTEEHLHRFANGEIVLRGDDKPCRPAQIRVLDDQVVEIDLTEGRYHQVRRMFAACGIEVLALHRTVFGPWGLDGLAEGEWCDLPPAG